MNYLEILTRDVYPAGSRATADQVSLTAATQRQVAAAVARQPLADPKQAEDRHLFITSPRSVIGAHQKAAYWLAVAARCSGAWSLADAASRSQAAAVREQTTKAQQDSYYDQAKNKLSRAMGQSIAVDPVIVSAILRPAADAIVAAAPNHPGAQEAAAALGKIADPAAIKAQQDLAASKGTIEQGRAAADAALESLPGLPTLPKLPEVDWKTVGIAGAAGLVGVIVLVKILK